MTKYLLGAAGVALLAATGAAQAADVTPVIVPPIVTPVVVAPAGPTITLTIDHSVAFGKDFGDPVEIFGLFSTELGIETASGLGLTISTDGGYDLAPFLPFNGGFELTTRVYKKFANFEIGAFVDSLVIIPGGVGILDAGFDFKRSAGIVTIENTTTFFSGGVANETKVTFDPSDTVSFYGLFGIAASGMGLGLEVGAGASLTLGAFSPYADIVWTAPGGLAGDLGVDFEKAIGNGPLSLIANLETGFNPGGYITGSVGIRLSFGGE